MATIVGLRRGKKVTCGSEFVGIDVVDGQQRLTNLAILLKALRETLNLAPEELRLLKRNWLGSNNVESQLSLLWLRDPLSR
jgi:uncharacterized protein with ParB-like and HNH nuclease domain